MQLQFQTARLNRANRNTNAQRVGWLGQLRVGQKLSLAAFAFAIPLTVLVSSLLVQQQSSISVAQRELNGVQQFTPLRDINTNLATFVATALRSDEGGAQKAADGVNKAISQLEAQVAPEYRERVQALRRDWAVLPDSIGTQPDLAILQTYAQLLNTYQRELSEDLLTQSGLMLDPVAGSFHTMESTLRVLPRISTGLNLAALTTEAGRREPGDDSAYLSVLRDLNVTLQEALSSYNSSVDRVMRADPVAGAVMGDAAQKLSDAVTPALADLGAAIDAGNLNGVDVQGIQNNALLQVGAAYNTGVKTLTGQLQDRVDRTERQRLLSLLAIITALVIAFTLLIRLSRAIVKPLTELTRASRAVSSGDLNVQVPVQTRDELGYMAYTFNNATTQLRVNEEKNVAEREEAAKLQNNIGSFLDVTMDIAGGDLTRRGVVSEDVLGNVVDSINLMVDELGQVLGEVQKASVSVTDASRDMLRTTDQIVQGAGTTTQETRRVAE